MVGGLLHGFEGRLLLLLEHLEHPVGDQEAADDVDCSDDERGKADPFCPDTADHPGGHQCPDDGDAANSVRAGHQRRVQRLRHLADHFPADEHRQHEIG